jgi:glycosyltransferase involved in cell wall biosynthesis
VTDGRAGWRPGTAVRDETPSGTRVVVDLRPLQDPERAPLTATYLDQLLGAIEAHPVAGESFTLLLGAERDDPSPRWPRLPVAGRRLLPPTRLLRSGALTVDPILLRGAVLGAGWRAERSGAAGSVYHAAAGALPIASGIPIVAAILDLAPWAMPDAYQRGTAVRFGTRLRTRLLRDASAVIVPSRAALADARRLLHVRAARLQVVSLAARPAFRGALPDAADDQRRLGLGSRYAAYMGRYDARHDLWTMLDALARLASEPRPGGVPEDGWPPRVCMVDASPDDRAAVARVALRAGAPESIAYAPRLPEPRLAALVAGARFAVLPLRAEASGQAALDALAAGVPVVASAVGALPEVVGRAGILVDPGDPARLATAIRSLWTDDALHAGLVAAARERAEASRTWADVARDTRAVWARVARPAPIL